MADNLHKGHRERLKNRLLKQGIDEHTPPHEVLEAILFYCIPRIDTNELAHELIRRFGSLSGVIDAPAEELMKVKGISKSSVAFLKLLVPICRAYTIDKAKSPKSFANPDELGNYLLNKHLGVTREVFSLLSLDAKGTFLGFDVISEGSATEVPVCVRNLVEAALKRGAYGAVICHNHPGGFALPSADDVAFTMQVADSFRSVGILLLDHVIVDDNDYVSLRRSARFAEIFKK